MLDKILGSDIAAKCLLSVYKYEEIYPSAIAADFKLTKSAVQYQLERFEDSGVLISRLVGKTRVYLFNSKSPVSNMVKDLVKFYFERMSISDKEELFARRRPRRKGKPVLKLKGDVK